MTQLYMEGRIILDKTLLIVLTIIAVAVVGIVASAYFVIAPMIYGNPLPIPTSMPYPGSSETPTQTTSMTEASSSTPTTSQVSGVDVSGYWHGVYDSRSGSSGEFTFYFRGSGNGFTGYLNITDVAGKYTGVNIPISVTVEGNTIKLGWVAVGATFTGTITGDTMRGAWSLQNNIDSGSWSASRGYKDIFSETQTPVETETVTTETTTEQATSTEEEIFNQAQDLAAPQEIEAVDKDIRNILSSVYGDVKLSALSQQSGDYYLMYIVPRKVEATDINGISNGFAQLEYEILSKISSGDGWQIQVSIEKQNMVYTLNMLATTDDQYIIVYVAAVPAS